ncbi:MAG: protein phosphatase 2C domain-containing protein, partial [Patescibacteria group bacterium]|nr:protein phosphatase 2C domain-containing protein [Patescibacteria group bacterium]
RANNQDSFAVVLADSQATWQSRGHLFMVADGMGAHAAGELASKLATDTVTHSYYKRRDVPPHDALLAAILDANEQIHRRGEASQDFKGMGTTGTVLALLPQGALIAHVGDSRAYRLRGNRFEQLTFDHSLVWEMQQAGRLQEGEVSGVIGKNIITRSLGPSESVQVDLEGPLPAIVGDTFLLCSDGLSGQVDDDEMGAVLMCLPPAEAVAALIDLAKLRGGPDNITVIVARVTGPQLTRFSDASGKAADRAGTVRPVHPLLWTALGVAGLGAMGFAALGKYLPALASLAVAAVVGAAALLWRYGGAPAPETLDGRPLGRGPYRAATCGANATLSDRFRKMVADLREGAVQEQWNVDVGRLDEAVSQADAVAEQGDFVAAVRQHLRTIHSVMEQIKQRRGGRN